MLSYFSIILSLIVFLAGCYYVSFYRTRTPYWNAYQLYNQEEIGFDKFLYFVVVIHHPHLKRSDYAIVSLVPDHLYGRYGYSETHNEETFTFYDLIHDPQHQHPIVVFDVDRPLDKWTYAEYQEYLCFCECLRLCAEMQGIILDDQDVVHLIDLDSLIPSVPSNRSGSLLSLPYVPIFNLNQSGGEHVSMVKKVIPT